MSFKIMPVVLCAVVGLVAGCGGSSNTTAKTTASKPAAASPVPATTTASATTTAAATPTFASTQNCQQLVDLGSKYLQQVSSPSSGGPIDFAAALKADQTMADASPPAIHSDAEYVVHAFSGYVTALGNAGYKPGSVPTASQTAALIAGGKNFSKPQFTAAMQRISLWIHQNCRGVHP